MAKLRPHPVMRLQNRMRPQGKILQAAVSVLWLKPPIRVKGDSLRQDKG